jgi:hypothetical protein
MRRLMANQWCALPSGPANAACEASMRNEGERTGRGLLAGLVDPRCSGGECAMLLPWLRPFRGLRGADEFAGATKAEGVLIDGAGSGTRTLRFRPNADDANWGLTKATSTSTSSGLVRSHSRRSTQAETRTCCGATSRTLMGARSRTSSGAESRTSSGRSPRRAVLAPSVAASAYLLGRMAPTTWSRC